MPCWKNTDRERLSPIRANFAKTPSCACFCLQDKPHPSNFLNSLDRHEAIKNNRCPSKNLESYMDGACLLLHKPHPAHFRFSSCCTRKRTQAPSKLIFEFHRATRGKPHPTHFRISSWRTRKRTLKATRARCCMNSIKQTFWTRI